VLQVVLIIYCVNNGDIYRILNGYDTCGNVCGRYNKPVEEYDKHDLCLGVNMSQKRCVKNLLQLITILNTKFSSIMMGWNNYKR